MRTALYILLIACSFFLQTVNATNLAIPGHNESDQKQVMPNRGINMDSVLSDFGEPNERIGPVGEPPISEWVYGSFRVYFEYQTVLHTIDLNTLIMPK